MHDRNRRRKVLTEALPELDDTLADEIVSFVSSTREGKFETALRWQFFAFFDKKSLRIATAKSMGPIDMP